eukprot:CFRG7971T1
MASLLKRQVVKHLAQYTENFRPEDLTLSMLSGEGELNMLEFNCVKLHEILCLPSCVILNKIVATKVKIKIHWTKLSSKPIAIELDGVTVQMELSNDSSRARRQKAEAEALHIPTKYGLVERVVDGITIQIRQVVILCKAMPQSNLRRRGSTDSFDSHQMKEEDVRLPHLLITISRIDLHSVNSRWQIASLSHTQRLIKEGKEVIMYKHLILQSFSLQLTPNGSLHNNKDDVDATLELNINPLEVRVTTRKICSTSESAATKVELIIDNAIWELQQNQISVAYNFWRAVSHLLDEMIQLEADMYGNNSRSINDSKRDPEMKTSLPGTNATSLPLCNVGGENIAESSFRVAISGLILRLTWSHSDSCTVENIGLVQIDVLDIVHYPSREYNTLGDDWVTLLHGVGPSVDGNIREIVSTLTCSDIVIIPLCNTEDVHDDYMKMLNKSSNEESHRRSSSCQSRPLLTLFYAEYSDIKTGTWDERLPRPTLWVDIPAIELTVNPYQWIKILAFFNEALEETPIPQSCKLAGRRNKYEKNEEARLIPDIKIMLSNATIVLPPFTTSSVSGDALTKIFIGGCVLYNREVDAGAPDHLFTMASEFATGELFSDAKVHFTDSGLTTRRDAYKRKDSPIISNTMDAFVAYKEAAYFPHRTSDVPICEAVAGLLQSRNVEAQLHTTWRIDVKKAHATWQADPHQSMEQIIWPFSATLLWRDLQSKGTNSRRNNPHADVDETTSSLLLIHIVDLVTCFLTSRQFQYLTEVLDILDAFIIKVDRERIERKRHEAEVVHAYKLAHSPIHKGGIHNCTPRSNAIAGNNGVDVSADVDGDECEQTVSEAMLICLKIDTVRMLLLDSGQNKYGPSVGEYQSVEQWLASQTKRTPSDVGKSMGKCTADFGMAADNANVDVGVKLNESEDSCGNKCNESTVIDSVALDLYVNDIQLCIQSSAHDETVVKVTVTSADIHNNDQGNTAIPETSNRSTEMLDKGPLMALRIQSLHHTPTLPVHLTSNSTVSVHKDGEELIEDKATADSNDNIDITGKSSIENDLSIDNDVTVQYPPATTRLGDMKCVVKSLNLALGADTLAKLGDFITDHKRGSEVLNVEEQVETEFNHSAEPRTIDNVMKKDITILNSVVLLANTHRPHRDLSIIPPPLQLKLDNVRVECSPENVWTVGKVDRYRSQRRRASMVESVGMGESSSFVFDESPLYSAYKKELTSFVNAVHEAQTNSMKAIRARRSMKRNLFEMKRENEESRSVRAQTVLKTKVECLSADVQRLTVTGTRYKEEMSHHKKIAESVLAKFTEQRQEYEKLYSSYELSEHAWRQKMNELETAHMKRIQQIEDNHLTIIANMDKAHAEQIRTFEQNQFKWKERLDDMVEERSMQEQAKLTMGDQMNSLLMEKEDEVDTLKRKLVGLQRQISKISLPLELRNSSSSLQYQTSNLSLPQEATQELEPPLPPPLNDSLSERKSTI